MGYNGGYGGWPAYVPVAERRRKAARKLEALKKKGRNCQPVVIEGRTIARTFWGKNWCDNLETYSDYASRLPRGRTYARNGSVIDLQIAAGKVDALVAGSEIYKVGITVHSLGKDIWRDILKECAGKVASLVELLQGRLSGAVMEVVTRRSSGLFPAFKQIEFRCSCPDSAYMCKHVAAVLYGIGARLDTQPELLFLLRKVDPQELIAQTAALIPAATPDALGGSQGLESADLSSLFGIDLDEAPAAASALPSSSAEAAARDQRLPAMKKTSLADRAASKQKPAPQALKAVPAKPAPRPKRAATITAKVLVTRGIPYYMMQNWLGSGVLLRTEKRGVYQLTKQTEGRVKAYLERTQTRTGGAT
jgi:uncharacterized Zn finger protein